MEKRGIEKKLYYAEDTLKICEKKTKKKQIKISLFLKWILRKKIIIWMILFFIYAICQFLIAILKKDCIFIKIISIISSLIPLLITICLSTADMKNCVYYTKNIFNIEIKEKIYKNIESNRKYKEENYEWYNFIKDKNEINNNCISDEILRNCDIEKFEMSEKVNDFLTEANFDREKIAMNKMKKKFFISLSALKCLNNKVYKKIENNIYIYNSKLVRQVSDLFIENNKITIALQKTDYFANIATNDLIFDMIKDLEKGTVNCGNMFSVVDYNSNTINLYDMHDSYCANIIGISTLAITKDGKIIVLEQGNCDVNSRRLAPSGSGSADYKKLKNNDFIDFLTGEMNREMLEEMQISKENFDMLNGKDNLISKYCAKTYVIGYCRLLNRGGKPDYFGITELDVDSLVIKKYFECFKKRASNNRIMELNEMYFCNSINELYSGNLIDINGNEKNEKLNLSLQLCLICELIKKLAKDSNMNDLITLAKRFCNK